MCGFGDKPIVFMWFLVSVVYLCVCVFGGVGGVHFFSVLCFLVLLIVMVVVCSLQCNLDNI